MAFKKSELRPWITSTSITTSASVNMCQHKHLLRYRNSKSALHDVIGSKWFENSARIVQEWFKNVLDHSMSRYITVITCHFMSSVLVPNRREGLIRWPRWSSGSADNRRRQENQVTFGDLEELPVCRAATFVFQCWANAILRKWKTGGYLSQAPFPIRKARH